MRSVEDEGAAGCCDVELVTDAEAGVQIAAGCAIVFALDGDPVVIGAGRPGKGVVPEHGSLLVLEVETQRQILAGACRWKRRAVVRSEANRDDGVALAIDPGHSQASEAGPGRRRAGRGQAGISGAALSFEQRTERRLPARAECGNP
jgi:hypothetical protein